MVELLLIFSFCFGYIFGFCFGYICRFIFSTFIPFSLNLECCIRMSIKDSFLEFSGLSRFDFLLVFLYTLVVKAAIMDGFGLVARLPDSEHPGCLVVLAALPSIPSEQDRGGPDFCVTFRWGPPNS